MKNILIAIPAFNEENTLSSLIKSIPKSLYKVKKSKLYSSMMEALTIQKV